MRGHWTPLTACAERQPFSCPAVSAAPEAPPALCSQPPVLQIMPTHTETAGFTSSAVSCWSEADIFSTSRTEDVGSTAIITFIDQKRIASS